MVPIANGAITRDVVYRTIKTKKPSKYGYDYVCLLVIKNMNSNHFYENVFDKKVNN